MAKSRRNSRGAGSEVKREMHRYKRGTAKSGRGQLLFGLHPLSDSIGCS
jgi:hypothetical protein